MRDLGQAQEFLGIKLNINKKIKEIAIHQKSYITRMLRKFRMDDSKPVKTPMDSNKKWMTETAAFEPTDEEEEKDFPYLEAVGSLLYLSQISRPDIAYAVGIVISFSKEPKRVHWQVVKNFQIFEGYD